MEGNYVKFYRDIKDWEWYRNLNTFKLFFHCVVRANWQDGKFEGKTIERGSFVSSYSRLAEETGLTYDEVRTAVKNLVKTENLTVKKHPKYSVFTVVSYDNYQAFPSQSPVKAQAEPSQGPSYSHANPNNRRKKEEKEGKKGKKENTSAPDDKSPCAGSFALNDGTEYVVSENDVITYQQLYPAIDVRQELRNIKAWCMSNPTKRKTKSGAKRFLNAWLSRSQNSARGPVVQKPPNRFHNFDQRETDYDALLAMEEKELYGG